MWRHFSAKPGNSFQIMDGPQTHQWYAQVHLLILNFTIAVQEKDLAWKLLSTAIGFTHHAIHGSTLSSALSFATLKTYYFPSATRPTNFSFTLTDLQALDIIVVPTHLIHEHLRLDGDKVKVFIISGASGCNLLAYSRNHIAK
jgi:hypothetical protein